MKNLKNLAVLVVLGITLLSCEKEESTPQLGTLQIGNDLYSLTHGILRHWGELDEGQGNYIHILEVSNAQIEYFSSGNSNYNEGGIGINFELYSSDPDLILDGDYSYKGTHTPYSYILGDIFSHDSDKERLIRNGVIRFKNLDSGYEISFKGKTTVGDSVICSYKGDLTTIDD
ncbi:MAG: hypothetical protein GX660_07075 [Clostridiaceae bacterium]|nr:hypothetical protein [Clostridiaceae bacterium]